MDLQCRVLSGWSLHERYLASQRELDLGDVRPRRAVDENMEITQFLQFRQRAGVEQIHACFGQPDIFVFINVADERALSDVVITRIHAIEGVEETDTHIVAET